jgi:hypothetical protein
MGMRGEEIELDIARTGEVRIHIKGVKGERCLDVVQFFQEIVGPVKDRQLTEEFYERDGRVRIDAAAEQQVRDAGS